MAASRSSRPICRLPTGFIGSSADEFAKVRLRRVAQTSKSAVSRISQCADLSKFYHAALFSTSAGWEAGDTAGWETCATTGRQRQLAVTRNADFQSPVSRISQSIPSAFLSGFVIGQDDVEHQTESSASRRHETEHGKSGITHDFKICVDV